MENEKLLGRIAAGDNEAFKTLFEMSFLDEKDIEAEYYTKEKELLIRLSVLQEVPSTSAVI